MYLYIIFNALHFRFSWSLCVCVIALLFQIKDKYATPDIDRVVSNFSQNPTNNTFMQLVHGSTNRSCFCWHLVHGKLEEKDISDLHDLEAKISFDFLSECLGLLLKCSALHSDAF